MERQLPDHYRITLGIQQPEEERESPGGSGSNARGRMESPLASRFPGWDLLPPPRLNCRRETETR
ncbi:hypothetical protein [Acetonema longum]|uniref:Uncharacterized protein n=1 Tax=Acetonema longum DSM 6540 TaxID=1009370 RepID=F7NG78_9FIRM|nr:hypothetical protein [Acetonema longum]EGO64996.1 hypothetical protein ALO_05323 [Acetonema longum DSM 6540]